MTFKEKYLAIRQAGIYRYKIIGGLVSKIVLPYFPPSNIWLLTYAKYPTSPLDGKLSCANIASPISNNTGRKKYRRARNVLEDGMNVITPKYTFLYTRIV